MWEIYEHQRIEKSIKMLPKENPKRYEKWKDIVRISGPQGLRFIRGFHDEALRGKWKGYRSSRLGDQYRIIYSIRRKEIYVEVFDITAHDYRRR